MKGMGDSHENVVAHATSEVSKRNNILTVVKNFTLEYKRINQYQFFKFYRQTTK